MRYHAAPPGEWLHPDDSTPPKGSKILMLNAGGIATIGLWQIGMAAWMPLPKVGPELKDRLRDEGRLK
ncbi:hypothetical protein SAMN05216428_102309 [Nitrosospira sp. Nsp11]|uniref:hypothetical protein n=1 Tax=Nitrosospira sp. Nsp11 TaxID=1855338 RepID=UPI0009217A6D|nr:hypothetical protein [Nitrosospira sp. Nsp11]SHL40861.1 hypothetical protein SAMN05216428_102309 [Nitrosospira sp. Nsp11]